MAKKRKAAGKKKAAKKASRKGASKKRAASTDPVAVKVGAGATPTEIGRAVVEGFNAGKPEHELWDRWWSKAIVSVEGGAKPMAWTGRKAMEAKSDWWRGSHTVHGASAEGPYVGASGFAIKFRIDAEETATGKREVMEEVGFYTVQKGKVVREEFCCSGTRQPVSGSMAPAS
jgi:hypothetical protein